MLRNIVYIPQWIIESIQRQKLHPRVVLDLKVLRQIVSLDDLVSLIALNNSLGELLGLDISLNIGTGLTQYWLQYADAESKDYLTRTVIPNIAPDTARVALERLVSDTWEEDMIVDEFVGIDLSADTSAIILKYGFFNSLNTQHIELSLIEEILQILYVYFPHHEIANSAVGRKYLELLALSQTS